MLSWLLVLSVISFLVGCYLTCKENTGDLVLYWREQKKHILYKIGGSFLIVLSSFLFIMSFLSANHETLNILGLSYDCIGVLLLFSFDYLVDRQEIKDSTPAADLIDIREMKIKRLKLLSWKTRGAIILLFGFVLQIASALSRNGFQPVHGGVMELEFWEFALTIHYLNPAFWLFIAVFVDLVGFHVTQKTTFKEKFFKYSTSLSIAVGILLIQKIGFL